MENDVTSCMKEYFKSLITTLSADNLWSLFGNEIIRLYNNSTGIFIYRVG